MSQFQLESWELPPHTEVKKTSSPIEFGPIEWNGEETNISARTVRFITNQMWAFFRPHNVEANFVLSSRYSIELFQGQMDPKKLERVVRNAIKGNQFSFRRAFYMKGQLCLMSPQDAAWKSRGSQGNCSFEVPFDASRESSTIVFDWLESQWEISDSEVRFSWEWSRKNVQERQEYLEERVPRWRELFQLMRAAARIAELPENARWILDHVDTHSHAPELLARLKPWREVFHAHFIPFGPFPDSAPLCLREYFRFISSHVSVQGEDVSQHERLEAGLQLRQWLERNAPERMDLLPS